MRRRLDTWLGQDWSIRDTWKRSELDEESFFDVICYLRNSKFHVVLILDEVSYKKIQDGEPRDNDGHHKTCSIFNCPFDWKRYLRP